MATRKSVEFLPEYLKTAPNRSFFGATLDQLISEPVIKKFNGYVGRQFAPVYRANDNYIIESTEERQNYQLEPGVVTVNDNNQVETYSSYNDILKQISFNGGYSNNHSRLFSNQSYSYDPHCDLDKLVNYNNYYWLSTGPDVVNVGIGYIPLREDFKFTLDSVNNVYTVDVRPGTNPEITVVRGGIYNFIVSSSQLPFYIQSEPGVSGTSSINPNINTRAVLGVTNNGEDIGTVLFTVPLSTDQDIFKNMPVAYEADLATTLKFSDIDNQLESDFINQFGTIDQFTGDLENKTLIFVDQSTNDSDWTSQNLDVDQDLTIDYASNFITSGQRSNVFRIKFDIVDNDRVIRLETEHITQPSTRIYVKSGVTKSGLQYYQNTGTGLLVGYPLITADKEFLYYQNGSNSSLSGRIKIVDLNQSTIDVESEILGKKNYTSPNGVVFTNGLKIVFDNYVTPGEYAGNTYWVEGVGDSIRLVSYSAVAYTNPDYITINRSSIDYNDWSRSNRWVHESVIRETARYRKETAVFDQTKRAQRPIIEFDADLQLFNHPTEWFQDVDYYDNTVTDAFGDNDSIVFAGQTTMTYQGESLVGATGKTIVFAKDLDTETRSTVYSINVVGLGNTNTPTILLLPADTVQSKQGIRIKSGTYANQTAYLKGTVWTLAQRKVENNQYPLFEVVDSQQQSLSLQNLSNFAGTKIFSYKVGDGNEDSVLGFSLSYKNLNNLGDIEFVNNFETDTYRYLAGENYVTKNISLGFLVKNNNLTDSKLLNVWITPEEKTQQYQLFTRFADGNDNQYSFDVIPTVITPNKSVVKVYVDNQLLNLNEYSLNYLGNQTNVIFSENLLEGTKLDVLIYSNDVSQEAFYQIPSNLEINSLNQTFAELTLGQLRLHTKQIFGSHIDLVGFELGSNNSRDLDYDRLPGTILQHSAPAVYTGLFLTNEKTNFVESIHYAQREYSKFKHRFLELAGRLNIYNDSQIVPAVDQVISEIVRSKNLESPWYYSDMVPYGTNKTTYRYEILNVDIVNYSIETIFDAGNPNNRAVLVYLNGQQLVKDRDYSFSTTIPAVELKSVLTRELGDILEIFDYVSTDGNYIPETPTKLGLYPKFEPSIFVDDRYSIAREVLRGHDGSITPLFGDYRDQMLLELELRIFNNIKVNYDIENKGLYWSVVPGLFRSSIYSRAEFDAILSRSFLKWVGNNQLDYAVNNTYRVDNPKTWNYSRSISFVSDEPLPGNFRAIYRYFYDTDRPHQAPWEMLGFTQQPDWWETYYGPAPYTRNNSILWDDLERGYIADGSRQGIDERFVRTGLSSIIPVDDSGNLLMPDSFLLKNFNYNDTDRFWAVGDSGPVETAWRNSSEFPFAIQIALALSRPAEYFGLYIDNSRYLYNTELNQIILSDSNSRIKTSDVKINGKDSLSNINRVASWTNYVAEYLQGQGIVGSVYVKDIIDKLDVRLSYQLAGFSDVNSIRIYAEQTNPGSTNDSILIPKENYQLKLHKSSPLRRATYSAVIIRRTDNGYVVEGYDYNRPYFNIIPSRGIGSYSTITGIEKTAKVFKEAQNVVLTIPYGYEFTSRQQIVDFLIGYERYLIDQGFDFSNFNDELNEVQNWTLSSREFLVWSEQGWAVNSILVLSPCHNQIKLTDDLGTVDEINGKWTGSRLLDQNFSVITKNNYIIVRDNNTFEISPTNDQSIGLCDLSVVQHEHILILDNETVFNDIVYDPRLGSRQYRLKLVGFKSGNWIGDLHAPGFIYNSGEIDQWRAERDYSKGDLVYYKNQIYGANSFIGGSTTFDFSKWSLNTTANTSPKMFLNFAAQAARGIDIYDVDADFYDQNLELYSNHLIGFANRQYFNDFTLETKSQLKFYQGFIKEKGTRNAVQALTKATFNKLTSDVDYSEEWAIRMGTYGAVDNQKIVELVIQEQPNTSDPFGIEILNNDESETAAFRSYRTSDLLSQPLLFQPPLFLNRTDSLGDRSQDIITAGFVKEQEVNSVIFDLSQADDIIAQLINDIGLGYTIWTAKDYQGTWNVLRAQKTNSILTVMSFGLDNTALVTTLDRHSFAVGDIIIVKSFDPVLNGVFPILDITGLNSFSIRVSNTQAEYLSAIENITGRGSIYIFKSSKFVNATDIADYEWAPNEYAWIDNQNSWQVYQYTHPWSWSKNIQSTITNNNWGSAIGISNDKNLLTIGAPDPALPVVEYYNLSNRDNIVRRQLRSPVINGVNFGKEVYQSDKKLFVADPGYLTNRGYIVVYNYIRQYFSVDQLIGGPVGAGEFGTSISVSDDRRWLYVSCPGLELVRAYRYRELPTNQINLLTNSLDTNYPLPWITTDSDAVRVYNSNSGVWLIPGIDYTTTGNEINFTVPPSAPATTEYFTIIETSYYKYIGNITAADNVVGDRFGTTVRTSTDGAQVIIAAPNSASNTGSVYVYDRMIEAFEASQGQTNFTVLRSLVSGVASVAVDNVYKNESVDYNFSGANTLIFTQPLEGSAEVKVEINSWVLVQKLLSTLPQTQSQFGYSIDFCRTNCSVYVSQPYYKSNQYIQGLVARYTNPSRIQGEFTGSTITTPNNCVTIGHSIRLNDYEVVFTGVSLDSVIANINAAQIPGISASRVNNKIKIISESTLTNNTLRIMPGLGTALPNLGITVFQHAQNIFKSNDQLIESFGTKISIDNTARKLLIASTDSYASIPLTFDLGSDNLTTFDINSTGFQDLITQSGAVYQYDLVTNLDNETEKFVYIQQLSPQELNAGDRYGKNIIMRDDVSIVLRKNSSGNGEIDIFDNLNNVDGWQIIREQSNIVDLNSIESLMLYDQRKNSVITYVDILDPNRGKVLGNAEENIDYKTAFDPAVYNRITNQNLDNARQYFWSQQQVGRVWWDLSTIRFTEYQQGDRRYRIENWGSIMSGASVDVYEWVESSVPPSQYVDFGSSGIPKNIDDSAYSQISQVDPVTGLIKTKYYFWVKDKITAITGRNISVTSITSIISDPKAQGIPYAAILDDSSLALYNCNQYLNGSDTVLKITVNQERTLLPIHNEWILIKEKDNETIPESVIKKLIDSLIGNQEIAMPDTDAVRLAPVPDPTLTPAQRYGIQQRPRQTMFVDRIAAAKIFLEYINRELQKHVLVGYRDLTALSEADPFPDSSNYDLEFNSLEEVLALDLEYIDNGTVILVRSDSNRNNTWALYEVQDAELNFTNGQLFNLPSYWEYVDWTSAEYDIRTVPDYTVGDFSQAPSTGIEIGQIIKINNTGSGTWGIYRRTDTGYEPLALEKATIQISDALYEPTILGIGLDVINFDTGSFDFNPSVDLRKIINAIRNDIAIDDLTYIWTRAIFAMFEYIFYEQQQPDWIFKTSFISVEHSIRKLIPYPSYVRDNQDYYQQYIEEVKPYKTKIREYLLKYQGEDLAEFDITDFDFPVFYDQEQNRYRHPDVDVDTDVMSQPPWNYWQENSLFSIGSVVIVDGGANYLVEPTVVINAGDGTAKLRATTFGGEIIAITVENPGNGFETTPTITIIPGTNPNGTQGSGAVLQAIIKNDKIRTFESTVRFDRIEYTGVIDNWQGSTAYKAGEYFIYNNQIYLVLTDFTSPVVFTTVTTTTLSTVITSDSLLTSGITVANAASFAASGYIKIDSEIFSYSAKSGNILTGISRARFGTTAAAHSIGATVTRVNYREAHVSDLNSAMKRAQYYYMPSVGMTPNDVRELYSGVDYPGVRVKADKFFPTEFAGSLTIVGSGVVTLSIGLGVLVEPGQSIRIKYNSSNYMDGTILSYNGLTGVLSVEVNSNVGSGTYSQWVLEPDLATLEDYLAQGDTQPELSTVDVLYRSQFIDTSLGLRPEDINVHGGAFVDVMNSHAPEELVPGRIYDTLEMRVFTKILSGPFANSHWGVRIFHSMNCNITDANLNLPGNVILENPMSNVDTTATVRTFEDGSILMPAVGFSPRISINGEVMRYTGFNPITNVISGITRGLEGTTAQAHPSKSFVDVYDNLKYQRFYYRISNDNTTTLTQALTETSTEISVVDASKLFEPSINQNRPGVIFIDGEKIIYWTRNIETNKLGQIIRGVHGTAVAANHAIGTRVEDASENQVIDSADYTTWTEVAVPTMLANSITSVASFIKDELSYNP